MAHTAGAVYLPAQLGADQDYVAVRLPSCSEMVVRMLGVVTDRVLHYAVFCFMVSGVVQLLWVLSDGVGFCGMVSGVVGWYWLLLHG